METTRAGRSRGIDDLVPQFGMRSGNAAVKFSIEHNPAANPGSHRYIDQPRLVLTGPPTSLRHGRSIGVVFQDYLHLKHAGQIFHWILPTPPGKKINFAKLSADRIYRTRRANPYAGDFSPGLSGRLL